MASTINEDLKPLKERMEETESEEAAALYAVALSIAYLDETIKSIGFVDNDESAITFIGTCIEEAGIRISEAIVEAAKIRSAPQKDRDD